RRWAEYSRRSHRWTSVRNGLPAPFGRNAMRAYEVTLRPGEIQPEEVRDDDALEHGVEVGDLLLAQRRAIGPQVPNRPRRERLGPVRWRSGFGDRYPAAFTTSKIGRYMLTTMPPTTTPRKTIIIGSISASRPLTAASTSS